MAPAASTIANASSMLLIPLRSTVVIELTVCAVCSRMFFTWVPSVCVAAATRRATAGGSLGAFANTTFGPLPLVTRSRYARFVTMNESFGADGNSCTMPTTWNGAT